MEPVLSDSNAIFDPSGEMLGDNCWRDETMSLLSFGRRSLQVQPPNIRVGHALHIHKAM
jgi:hypothetical protein